MLVDVHVVCVDACECYAAVVFFWRALVFDALLRREWLDVGEKYLQESETDHGCGGDFVLELHLKGPYDPAKERKGPELRDGIQSGNGNPAMPLFTILSICNFFLRVCEIFAGQHYKKKSYLITSTIIRYEIVKAAADGNDEECREAQEHKCGQSRAKDKSDNHVSCQ